MPNWLFFGKIRHNSPVQVSFGHVHMSKEFPATKAVGFQFAFPCPASYRAGANTENASDVFRREHT